MANYLQSGKFIVSYHFINLVIDLKQINITQFHHYVATYHHLQGLGVNALPCIDLILSTIKNKLHYFWQYFITVPLCVLFILILQMCCNSQIDYFKSVVIT